MVKCIAKEYKDLLDLEFELLTDLSDLKNKDVCLEDERDSSKMLSLKNLFYLVIETDDILKVVYEVDSGVIGRNIDNGKLCLINRPLEVGGLYVRNRVRWEDDSTLIKINPELLVEQETDKLSFQIEEFIEENGLNRNQIRIIEDKNENIDELNFDVIYDKFEIYKKEILEKKKREEEEEEERKRQDALKEGEEERIYTSLGEISNGRSFVKGNVISKYNGEKYILDKRVNEVFNYNEIYNILNNEVEYYLRIRRINYIKEIEGEKGYEVVYSDGKCKINDVPIPSSKVDFIFNRLSKSYETKTKERIKILLKLNGMKADLIDMNYLSVEAYKIPISINAVDSNNFIIEFLGKKKDVSWKEAKNLFFYGGGSRSCKSWFNKNTIINFCENIGVKRDELFLYLKKLKMLENLEENK